MVSLLTALALLLLAAIGQDAGLASPTAAPWPLQFHALLFVNTSAGSLQTVDLWYDWPHGRNFNIIHKQLSSTLHDLEWTNGTSFFYDLDAASCSSVHFEVGILRPDWIVDNATYLGQFSVDGFTCNAWSKADFIVYYEDIETNRPVHWVFYTGMSIHVMTYDEGAVLEDSQWQAPAYCFDGNSSYDKAMKESSVNVERDPLRRWLDGLEASSRTDLQLTTGMENGGSM